MGKNHPWRNAMPVGGYKREIDLSLSDVEAQETSLEDSRSWAEMIIDS